MSESIASCLIQTETIELAQFLKLADLCQSGGEAKFAIQNGQVTLNGAPETRRSKKLQVGDRVGYQGREVSVARA
jgi:ribosome-associated protein